MTRRFAFFAIAALLLIPRASHAEEDLTPEVIVVTPDPTLGASGPDRADVAEQRTQTGDSALLLRSVAGVSLYGAGGISTLPAIHGLADDRLRVQVDGVDLMPACPNHMNSPLSYADPAKVASVTVYSGITPVSVGGDSIGGSIQVKSAAPEFAGVGAGPMAKGRAGSFYRSNGGAYGHNLGATVEGEWLNLTYSESTSQSKNFVAGGIFKPVQPGREEGQPIAGDEVASSAYRGATNRALGAAVRLWEHILQLEVSRQTVDFEGFPNQRMDMTRNDNKLLSLHYMGQWAWGDLEAHLSYQATQHTMDMGPDRYFYGTGMPMDTKAKTRGALLKGNVNLSERDILRVGLEYQYYTLYDWWPPVGGTMGPNVFWNIDYGQRRKTDAFVEWEAHWNDRWASQVGVRGDTVMTDSGPVQGYDNGLAATWGDDAAALNGRRRAHTDHNWDFAVAARYTPGSRQSYEGGYSRKSRSPNLYQRYPWSTNAMAALMNNFVGDGNGYIGNPTLKPEVAHTFSLTGDWHDADQGRWRVKASSYLTLVQDYIDARRCDFGQCSAANVAATTGFVRLQYANSLARLYGSDLSGRLLLADTAACGSFAASSTLSYVRGVNLSTDDNLYSLMPLNVNFALAHRLGSWSSTAELLAVAPKKAVSRVRNEVGTRGYYVLNLRSSYEWKPVRVDVSVENLLNRYYANPVGGAYVGQGPSMTTQGVPWGIAVPGKGRSFNVALNLEL